MSTRISNPVPLLLLPILLTGCGGRSDTANTDVLARVEAQQRVDAEDDGRILCAHGDAPLTRDCTVDRTDDTQGLILTLRHPDGGFRRLRVTGDGRGVVAADGADEAKVSVVGAEGIEVALGGDRYRLPATIGKTGS